MLFTHATSEALINNYTYVNHAFVQPTNTPLPTEDEEKGASHIQRTRAYYEEACSKKKWASFEVVFMLQGYLCMWVHGTHILQEGQSHDRGSPFA